MTKCTCHYEVSDDIIRHDINQECEVHGAKKGDGR